MWANRVCFIAFKDKPLKMNTFRHKRYKSLVFSGIIKVQYFLVLFVVIVARIYNELKYRGCNINVILNSHSTIYSSLLIKVLIAIRGLV